MVLFTDNQKKALDLRRHLAITANAGAGKTAVLVERYIAILATTAAQVRDVVALTYTEKAASELRTKIARSLEGRLRSAGSAAERAAIERIRDQLPSATIGTIHSFCAQLLREYPLEADVDAGFGIIEEVERASLLGEVLARTLSDIASAGRGEGLRDELFALVRTLGRKRVENYLATLLDKREQVDRMTGEGGIFREPIDDAAVLRRWEEALAEALAGAFDALPWEASVRTLLGEGAGAEELRRILSSLRGPISLTTRGRVLADAYEMMFTKDGGLRRRLFGRAVEAGGGDVALLERLPRVAGELVSAMRLDPGASAEMLAASRRLLNVYHACYEAYAARKADLGKLDFEDLQLKVRDLLRQPEVRERIGGRYTHVLVDEFQDTNTLQYEIILKLLDSLGSGNLFVVGDPKQSIYGFRNAEVEVFRSSAEAIARSSSGGPEFLWEGSELPSTEAERRGNILLAESFRPLPALAAAVNAVFRTLSAAEQNPFDVPYTDLATGRTGTGGAVELLLVEGAGPGGAPAGLARDEARAIARRIAGLCDGSGAEGDSVRFGDCAVLLRRRANIRELELAFAEHGVPYLLSGGVGFYQTQEVYDLYNLFRFLLNRDDDIALAGVLRSPFVALSDAELFEISREQGGSFWQKTLKASASGRGSQTLAFGVRLLRGLQVEAARLPAPQLVRKLLAATGWIGTASAAPTGQQRLANVRKLVRHLRKFEEGGLVSLFDLVERLKGLVEEHVREGQAALDAAGDAVRVMTIHAAKGLEFPVVFVPFLHEKFRYDTSLHVDPALGLGFALDPPAPALKLFRFRSRSRTEAEERRIFYVACTRAKNRLVLSAQRGTKLGQESRLKWLLSSLNLPPGELKEGSLALAPETLETVTASGGRFVRSVLRVVPAIEIIAGDSLAGAAASRPPERREGEPGLLVEPIEARGSGEILSATYLKTYLECPTKYYLRYVLGLPEQGGIPVAAGSEEDPDDRFTGELEGSLAHKVLQNLGRDREQAEELVRSVVAAELRLPPEEKAAASRALSGLIDGCLDSAFFTEIFGSKERKTEFSISMAYGGGYLTGTIDCLYRSTQGSWSIVDYKSDSIPRAEAPARAETYRTQVGFYAFLVSRFFRQESVAASVLFLRHPDAPVHFRFGPDELARTGALIGEAMKGIAAGDFRRPSRLCSACTYRQGDDCLIPFNRQ